MSIQEEFVAELQALINKYDVEIEADDHYPGYPECGQDIRITATFRDDYDSVDLGRYIFPVIPQPVA